jgi:hypothetical protein
MALSTGTYFESGCSAPNLSKFIKEQRSSSIPCDVKASLDLDPDTPHRLWPINDWYPDSSFNPRYEQSIFKRDTVNQHFPKPLALLLSHSSPFLWHGIAWRSTLSYLKSLQAVYKPSSGRSLVPHKCQRLILSCMCWFVALPVLDGRWRKPHWRQEFSSHHTHDVVKSNVCLRKSGVSLS